MKRVIISLGLLLSTVSCTTIPNALNPLAPDKGINATVQLGKENHKTENKTLAQIDSKSTTTNDNKAEVINQKYESMPPWVLLLIVGLAGVAIPNPFEYPQKRRNQKLLDKLIEDKVNGGKQESNIT